MNFHKVKRSRRCILSALITIVIATGAALLSGCATLEDDSDLPWNAPQSWEGSPSIPGFNQY